MTDTGSYTTQPARLSRRWWLGALRSALAVIAFTVLIWVYADMEFTTEKKLRTTIRLTTGKAQDLALISGSDFELEFTVVGPRNSLDEFESSLKEFGAIVEYDLSDYAPGSHPIPTRDILNSTMDFSKGVTIKSVSPEGISCRLERLLRREVPVEFDATGLVLAGPAIVKPPKVTIRITESQWNRIQKDLSPDAVVLKTTRRMDLQNASHTEPTTVNVEIVPMIAGIDVDPEPATVEVTLHVSQLTDSKSFIVALRVLTPPTWATDGTWGEYQLQGKDGPLEWRKEITVSGAKKDLDQLKSKDIDAYILLTDDDKKPVDSWLSHEVVIRLPEALNLKLTGEKPAVNFKLIKRPTAVTP